MEKMICTAACAARVFANPDGRMRVLAAFVFVVLSVFGASASGAVSVTYSFAPPRVVAGADSSTVTVAGCDPFARAGEPVLPFRTARILIPDGQTVRVAAALGLTLRRAGEAPSRQALTGRAEQALLEARAAGGHGCRIV